MSSIELPRLITEVVRGTERHSKLKTLRSASERTNSSAKEDFRILVKPKVRGHQHAVIISQLAVITVLLKRICSFIIKVTLSLRSTIAENKRPVGNYIIPGPKVPAFILNLVQRQ